MEISFYTLLPLTADTALDSADGAFTTIVQSPDAGFIYHQII